MWQPFIITFFDWWNSILIRFDQVWTDLIQNKKTKNKTVISILSVNVATFYSNMFWLGRNPVWTDLKSNSHFYPICKCEKKLETFFDLWEIQFDQVWSSLIHFGQIWSKKIQNQTGIFILFVNVKTFYRNTFWFVRNPIWSSLIHFGQIWSRIKQAFLFFL